MDNNLKLEMGERVRIARNSRGLSREALSEMLEISPLFLGYIECGQRGMSITTLQKLCKVLNVSADYILSGADNSKNDRELLLDAIEELEPKYIPIAIEQINNLKKTIAIIKHTENQN
ncbi:MAG: helix-turn-helix transcriptional regulator [Clostridia bacterium]|nr:helix-turn-helix transcriptional regulator [Clostridia bacterium]